MTLPYSHRQLIYFLRPKGEQGPIKIGLSRKPASRLRTYEIWSPAILELAASCHAHMNSEQFLHRHFLGDYLHGEWFEWSEELQQLIDHVAEHETLPDWVIEGTPTSPREWSQFKAKYPRGKPRRSAA